MSDISTPNHWHIYASTEPGKAILAVNADGTVILHGKEVSQSIEEKAAIKTIFAGFMKGAPSVREAVEAERGRTDRVHAISVLLASYTASANSQLDRGGWQYDWDELMNPLRQELHELLGPTGDDDE